MQFNQAIMTPITHPLAQTPAIAWLQRAYAADHLPHGHIFAGPVGVGKATTAAALGALLLCDHPKSNDACDNCDSCRVLAVGNHPDYRVITKELIRQYDRSGTSKAVEFSIHVIRPELVDRAGRKSVLGRGKVFVIEQAELLTAEAQNAMLKTLEEPAERTVIILLTDQPGLLLPTIRSRCQLVRFSPLPQEMVKSELEKRKIDKRTAASAAKLSQGSLGIALKWIEDGVIQLAEELVEKLDAAHRRQTRPRARGVAQKKQQMLMRKNRWNGMSFRVRPRRLATGWRSISASPPSISAGCWPAAKTPPNSNKPPPPSTPSSAPSNTLIPTSTRPWCSNSSPSRWRALSP